MSESKPAAAPDPMEIAGRYQVLKKLGAGAFGTVYLAKDTTLGRQVAIKTIRLEGLAASVASLDDLLARFKREATVSAQLKHPNIVTIYDIGEVEGLSYIAMEFIEGVGLDGIIRESGKVPLARAAGLMAQVADALDYAHKHGVVHRDIKPANIMVEAGERVKVADFGIARATESGDNLTATGSLLGTPSYMSPEQAKGERVQGPSDLFSVGCVLYELLAGRRAFRGDSITALIFKVITKEPDPLKEIDPSIPDEAVRIVQKALAKDVKDRYQTGREMADDLLSLAHPGHVPTVRNVDTPTASVAAPNAPTISSPPTAEGSLPALPTLEALPTEGGASAGSTAPPAPTRISPPPVPPAPPPAPSSAPARSRRPTPAPSRRARPRSGGGKALGVLAAAAVLGVLAVGTWFVLGRNSRPALEVSPQVAQATPAPTTEPEATSPVPDSAVSTPAAAPEPSAAGAPTPTAEAAPAQAAPRLPPRQAPPQQVPQQPAAPSGSTGGQPAPPPRQSAPPPPPNDDFLDELPEDAVDGRAAGEALASQYRSGSGPSTSFGSTRGFRRRPRIPRHTPEEQPAVRALAWILSAQNGHMRRTGRYGTLDELVQSGDLPLRGERTSDGFERQRYRFTVTASGEAFRADARPLSPTGRAFYVDEAGYVLVDD